MSHNVLQHTDTPNSEPLTLKQSMVLTVDPKRFAHYKINVVPQK